MPRQISEHVAAALRILAGDDDPGFVGVLARAHRRIDGYDHAHEVGQDKAYRRPCRLDQCPRPQGARYIVEKLGIEFLAAEASALVLLDDLRQKGCRQIEPIVVPWWGRRSARG